METARHLVDFGGGAMSKALAEDQLQGAVALHNVLAKEGFAYLADEVGMGKTYVALGVVSLIRFFHPGFSCSLHHTSREYSEEVDQGASEFHRDELEMGRPEGQKLSEDPLCGGHFLQELDGLGPPVGA